MLLNRPVHVVVALAVAAAVSVGTSAAASAAVASPAQSSADAVGGWQPYRQQPVTLPAGTVCAFTVDSVPVRDEERYRTLATYPDGTPRLQEFTGSLVGRFTNRESGTSVVRDLSGTAFFSYGRDGSLVVPWFGKGNVSVHDGNRGYPVGDWVFDGTFLFVQQADGTRDIHQFTGTRENLCLTLADSSAGRTK